MYISSRNSDAYRIQLLFVLIVLKSSNVLRLKLCFFFTARSLQKQVLLCGHKKVYACSEYKNIKQFYYDCGGKWWHVNSEKIIIGFSCQNISLVPHWCFFSTLFCINISDKLSLVFPYYMYQNVSWLTQKRHLLVRK